LKVSQLKKAQVASQVRGQLQHLSLTTFNHFERMLDLSLSAKGGALVIIAEKQELERLDSVSDTIKTKVEHTDDGFMYDSVRDLDLFGEDFADWFVEFSAHAHQDRWQHPHPGAGRPKDGAWLIDEHGVNDVAVKLRGLPAVRTKWKDTGTRHETALEVVTFLKDAIVI
jgi:hypothetical protein